MNDDNQVKISTKNKNLARKIIEQKATITKHENGTDIDLISVIGARHESHYKTKAKAIDEAVEVVGGMLERQELSLSDTWEKDNLSKQRGRSAPAKAKDKRY